MARRDERRRLCIGLIASLAVNAALLAWLAPLGGEVAWRPPADTEVAVRLELRRAPMARPQIEPATSPVRPRAEPTTRSAPPLTQRSALAHTTSPSPPTPVTKGLAGALPSPPSDPAAKAGGDQGDADLRARMALALRKLGACSRVTSGAGDAQDKALCSRNFAAAADGPTIETIPVGERADYDAAHAKAGYLVPADAANPNFVTSQFKRGGTVWTLHAGCALEHGKWRCGVR